MENFLFLSGIVVACLGLLAFTYALHVAVTQPKKTLEEAQELFLKQYGHLWYPGTPGGITTVGCLTACNGNPTCLSVGIADSEEVWNQIPDHFAGYMVCKHWAEPAEPFSQGV